MIKDENLPISWAGPVSSYGGKAWPKELKPIRLFLQLLNGECSNSETSQDLSIVSLRIGPAH